VPKRNNISVAFVYHLMIKFERCSFKDKKTPLGVRGFHKRAPQIDPAVPKRNNISVAFVYHLMIKFERCSFKDKKTPLGESLLLPRVFFYL